MSTFRYQFRLIFILLICLAAGLLVGWLMGGGIIQFNKLSSFPKKLTQPMPGNCLLLEEKYCTKAEPAYYKNDQLVMIGFRLPADTPIFAPFTGTMPTVSMMSETTPPLCQ